ncbi:MAG: DUF2062 domain-containing protein, partial [Pseudomonadota bacterium]|nr:DUF2062 domain-containing protein [Pseudomonadota bacterium]
MFRRRVPLSFSAKIREILWPRKGFARLYSYLVQRVLRMPGSAYSLASGFACGVAVSFTPLIGFHLLLAFGVALRGRSDPPGARPGLSPVDGCDSGPAPGGGSSGVARGLFP